MDPKITALNRLRGALRQSVTKLENYIKQCASEDKVVLETKLTKVDTIRKKLFDLQKRYYELPPEADLTETDEAIEQMETSLEEMEVSLKYLISKYNIDDKSTKLNIKENKTGKLLSVKLPDIPLPQFSGKYEEFGNFKSQFISLIEDNDGLSNTQKLYYLKSSLTGEAKLIQTTDDTYKSLLKALEDRYVNKRAVVDSQILSLINLEKLNYDSAEYLRKLLDTVKKNLRTLKTLEYERNNLSDVLIINLILQKLDKETRKQFEITLKSKEVPDLDNFLTFLENRILVLEYVNKNVPSKSFSKDQSYHKGFSSNDKQKPKYHQFAKPNKSFVVGREDKMKQCLLCNKDFHPLYRCFKFQNMSVHERIKYVSKENICKNCLNAHKGVCRSTLTCRICNSKTHNTMLHQGQTTAETLGDQAAPIKPHKSDGSINSAQNSSGCVETNPEHLLTASISYNSQQKSVILSTADIYVRSENERYKLRCLLDSASASCLLSNRACNLLNLKREPFKRYITGIGGNSQEIKARVKINISNEEETYSRNCEFLIVPRITSLIPSQKINISNIEIPNHVKLADPNFCIPGKIDMLIGSDIFFDLLKADKIRLANGNLILQESELGYVVSGKLPTEVTCNYCCVAVETNLDNAIKEFFEIESFPTDSFDSTKSEEEKFCEEHFLKTHSRTKSGRYIVSLPMKENADSVLGFSRENAVKRLNGIWNKLNKNNTLATLYKAFLQEYLDLGHMQQIMDEDNTKSYYIPHHCIYKPEKTTTPLRVVFDASAKTSTGQSLNSILLNGGSIQDDLFSLVTRFRTHKYAFSADIQKMYRQILVEPSQRYLQRIVWKETNNSPIKIYELNTVTYGTVSAPFLAMRVLKALADAEHQDFPEAAKIITRDMYVDDILSGATSLTSAKRLQADLSKLLRRGGFELHKWVSNHPALLNDISTSEYSFEDTQSNTVKALGMLWKPQPDQLTFKVSVKKKDSLTKREVLSQIARLYDPLGIIGPVIAKAKIFMQSLWLQKLDWNDNLPTKVLQVWNDFLVKLPGVNEINVPRYILSEDVTKIELHGFSDASERAFGAVIYIRCVTHSGLIQTKLVCSKSRVSPLKPITVPRLELSAALLLARLMHKIVPVLDLPLDKICLWTDSKIVLAWLNMQPHMLKTFVSNRVAKIQSLCFNSQWRHVSSKCNPADVLSRGADAKDLRDNDLWWQGPAFLLRDITDPEEYPCPKDKTFEQELKRNVTVSCAVTNDFDFLDKLLNLTNNYSKLIRILSFCCRFIKNCLHKNVETGFLTAAELDNAEQLLIKQVQSTTFAKEITALQDGKSVPVSSKLKSLDPFLDNNSILRVGGRLKNANLDYDA
ncbi:hypothetical protein AVEN_118861-1, partial [Araneus ventricosus]